jgi:hypothetical protein
MMIPCKECLILPVCRHKELGSILRCSRLTNYNNYFLNVCIIGSEKYYKFIRLLRKNLFYVIKPTKWEVDKTGCMLSKGVDCNDDSM